MLLKYIIYFLKWKFFYCNLYLNNLYNIILFIPCISEGIILGKLMARNLLFKSLNYICGIIKIILLVDLIVLLRGSLAWILIWRVAILSSLAQKKKTVDEWAHWPSYINGNCFEKKLNGEFHSRNSN